VKKVTTTEYVLLKEYVQYLYRSHENRYLSHISDEIAECFLFAKELSVSECTDMLNSYFFDYYGRLRPDKTIHKKVHQLLLSNILDKKFKKSLKKEDINKKRYHISSFGIYYIFFLSKNVSHYDTMIITNHQNDNLFKFFLYPYILLETIQQLQDKDIISLIFSFLSTICKGIATFLAYLELTENVGGKLINEYTTSSLLGDRIDEEDSELRDFIDDLEERHGIHWNDIDKIEAKLVTGSKNIKISDGIIELFLKILPEKHRAQLLEKDIIICEYVIKEYFDTAPHRPDYIIYEIEPMTYEEFYDQENWMLVNFVERNITSLGLSMIDTYPENQVNICENEHKFKDLYLLYKDPNFRKCLDSAKQHIEKSYTKLNRISNLVF
jgi:hypothetical protein